MESFEFYLDQKVTTWMRTPFTVEAESEEIARQKAIEFVRQGGTDLLGWDEVMDTKEVMSVEENGGESTEEIFTYDGVLINSNSENNG